MRAIADQSHTIRTPVHIFELIGFRNRILVMVEWAAAYITTQRSVRLITYQDQLDR